MLTNEGKRLTGDSLFYDRVKGYGEAVSYTHLDVYKRQVLPVWLPVWVFPSFLPFMMLPRR